MQLLRLTYFNIEGRAEPIRVALALAQVPFEDRQIAFSEWPALKPSTPFGQLPVVRIVDDVGNDATDPTPYRAQSRAILHWIGTDLAPQLYPKDKVLDIEEAMGIIDDLDRARFPAFYMNRRPDLFGLPPNWNNSDEGKKILRTLHDKVLNESIPKYVQHLTDMLEKNGGTWLASTDGPTIADCLAVPFLRSFTNGYMGTPDIPPTCLDKYPAIVQYVKRFCSLPEIQGRYSTGLY